MIRDRPCEEPCSCAGVYCSIPSTRTPRRARWYAAALPIAPRPSTMMSVVGIGASRSAHSRLRGPAPPTVPRQGTTGERRLSMNFSRRRWSAVAPAGGVGYHRRHMATSRPAPRQPVRRPTSGKLRAILQDVGTPPPAPFVPAPFQEAALAAVRSGDVLVAAPGRSRLLLLSATFPNAEVIASWLAEVRGKRPEVIVERVRPVPLRYVLADARGRLIPPDALGHLPSDGRASGWLAGLIRELEHYSLLPAILFYPARRQCDEAARELAAMRAFGPELRAAAFARWEREFPFLRAHAFRSAITDSGIAPHHAGHTTAWRLAVEDLLARGLIRVVCATTTLAAGLDVPARTVALSTLVRNSPDGPVVLSATEFHQMSGRAGRRGKDTIGVVVLPATSRDEAREGLALIDAEPDPVTSSVSPGYVQVVNLLRRSSLEEALPALNRSLAAYEKRGEVQRLKNAIGSIPPDDLAERPCDDRLITRGRYERMAERLRKLQKQRGTQADIAALSAELTAWPCATCPVEQRCLATLEALRARELRRSSLRQALHSLEGALADEFTRRAAVLRRLGYLDENSRLTPEGLWASELRHPRMLVLAEIVRRSLIGGSTAAWAAVAGALATERAPYRGGEAGGGAFIQLGPASG